MKYNRTPHAPWSLGGTADDERLANLSDFANKDLIVLEKMDGENTVMTKKGIHARSEDSSIKPWQTYIKGMWSKFCYDIPDWMHICGENMYAVHSIEYDHLTAPFYVFAIYDESEDLFLSWEDVEAYSLYFGLQHVPEIKRGMDISEAIDGVVHPKRLEIDQLIDFPIPKSSAFGKVCEGYVIRNFDSFPRNEFAKNVCKCVREGHVQTDIHWTTNWKKAHFEL